MFAGKLRSSAMRNMRTARIINDERGKISQKDVR